MQCFLRLSHCASRVPTCSLHRVCFARSLPFTVRLSMFVDTLPHHTTSSTNLTSSERSLHIGPPSSSGGPHSSSCVSHSLCVCMCVCVQLSVFVDTFPYHITNLQVRKDHHTLDYRLQVAGPHLHAMATTRSITRQTCWLSATSPYPLLSSHSDSCLYLLDTDAGSESSMASDKTVQRRFREIFGILNSSVMVLEGFEAIT